MDKADVVKKIKEARIVAIIRGVEEIDILATVQALVDGGIEIVEVTFDHKQPNFTVETVNKIKKIKDFFGERILVGAGTVLTESEVEQAVNAGAELIISPNVSPQVIKKTISLNKVSMPGALTPTEALVANEAGADFVKLFPAGELGINYLKALMGPLQHLNFIAVGGVTPDNVKEFINIGILGIGVGGSLVNKEAISKKEFSKLTEIAKQFTANL
ncbi:bifunctional 4-hydroxy-2-oxoglutarate aldolase/2-dehydro-3-deoxy-phosphogluconate aldolase [Planomicrobium sp. CPCC 101079]|uniref:bifunctional 4-hydroxy-2-oxoglutarate aldolase/2-dehydro-3-deoxy-phosphogluconate aldolase n=1 Tax=Planomicrobium sp. CPCC 101079 TaxID=2599618 RepID=UPI0011B6F398|nr:bifunctional 4-hydroxy-2-oxoglutarate aldolase/2-dehydro-3-deoxy-phosphogluconate aldolase [Planomicrobium sp. CPCC 101079]TWT01768.1 bifunctional 4-hydroxy-2-oxoglutarate aldolase/2-dehydro-3-deoxy-phosphogluconate aldolase [Planomicrobium sp. CPCC 101079]